MSDITPIKQKRGRKPKALSNPPPEIVLVNEELPVNPPPAEKITILVSAAIEDAEHEDDVDVDTEGGAGTDINNLNTIQSVQSVQSVQTLQYFHIMVFNDTIITFHHIAIVY